MKSTILKPIVSIILFIVAAEPAIVKAGIQENLSGLWVLDGESMLKDPEISKRPITKVFEVSQEG